MYNEIYLPCYAYKGETDNENTVEKCLESIDNALEKWFHTRYPKGILVISITDKDKYKDCWMKAIAEYNDVACCTTMSVEHGDYQCYMFMIPVFQNLGRTH